MKNEPAMRSCTPAGIINLLRSQNIAIEGKKIVVIGRSLLVGKPLSLMLLNLNGTVTMTHSKTLNLNKVCREADILIAAAGKPNLVDSSLVKEGAGIINLLRSQNITIEGKKIVVIGRSLLVGKPLSLMFLNLNGTVTITHSKTLNLNKVCKEADILIAAAGKPNLVDSSFVKEGAVIIDVGIHRLKSSDKNQTRLCGDVLLEDVISKVFAYTPVPGGVGPMTVTMLLVNTIFSWQKQFGLSSTLNDLLP